MKKQQLTFCLLLFAFMAIAQNGKISMEYEPSPKHPYGQLNPSAPP